MAWLRYTLKIGGPVVSVAALHTAIIFNRPELGAAMLCIGVGLVLLAAIVWAGSKGEILVLAGVFSILSIVAYRAFIGDDLAARLVVVPPVLINAWLAYYFGRTLVAGREPLITRFSRISRGEVPAPLMTYSRRLTIIWTVYFIAFSTIALFSAATASLENWTWTVNVGGPGLAFLLFLGEHAYRGIKYRHFGHNSPIRTLGILLNPKTWTSP
ncbi:hypothetical protein ACFL12_08760 [Pseudomonadota bacterium]